MKNKKIVTVALLLVAASGAAYWSYHKRHLRTDDVEIRVLDSTAPSEFELAKELTGADYLQEEGVHLHKFSSVEASGGTVSIQALVAHNIDYGGSAWPAWINAIASGAKIKAVVNSNANTKDNPGNGLVVLADSNINTVKDLVGKRIAVNVLGASADYEIRDLLRRNGLTSDQVQLVVVPMRNEEQALRSHQVDVIAWTLGGGVDYELAIAHGGVRELPNTRRFDLRGTTIILGSGFREDFIQQHPQTVTHFINAIERSRHSVWDAWHKDPEAVRKAYAAVAARKGGNPQLAKYYKINYAPEHLYANDADIQWWIDILVADGKLKPGQIKPSDIYTHQYNLFYKK